MRIPHWYSRLPETIKDYLVGGGTAVMIFLLIACWYMIFKEITK